MAVKDYVVRVLARGILSKVQSGEGTLEDLINSLPADYQQPVTDYVKER